VILVVTLLALQPNIGTADIFSVEIEEVIEVVVPIAIVVSELDS